MTPDPQLAAPPTEVKLRLRLAEKVRALSRRFQSASWILVVIAITGSTTVSLARGLTNSTTDSELYRQLNLFGEVLERVRSDYVEKPDDSKLIEAAINGMLSSLDPHLAFCRSAVVCSLKLVM